MKNIQLCIFGFLLLSSCCKLSDKNFQKNYKCEELNGVNKFIFEEIVYGEECNCIISGKVKYVKDCETIALIDYGNGACDNIATKIICENGNCFGEEGTPPFEYEYTFDCSHNIVNEGIVLPSEINDLHDPNTGPQP